MQFLTVILIQVNHDEEQDKISDGFVELSRMTGEHIYTFEYETAISAAKSYVENTKLYNSEIVNVSGGELNYITEYDYIDHVVNIKPVWIFIKESLFNDRKPFYDSIIIDALTGNKYE